MRAREMDIDLEIEIKRKSDQAQVSGVSCKSPKVFNLISRGWQSRSYCNKCDKTHDGACRMGGYGCFKYCQMGHSSRDCTSTTTTTTTPVSKMICCHCNQTGHKKPHYPSLEAAGPVVAPTPAML